MLFNNNNMMQMLSASTNINMNGNNGMRSDSMGSAPGSMLSTGSGGKGEMDFTILNEDFPALPGSQPTSATGI